MAARRQPDSDLFGPADPPAQEIPAADAPLADRLRPRQLAEVVGQEHLLGEGGTISAMLARGSLSSLILWGPPGVGKTTIARLLAEAAGLVFVSLSAVFSGVADLKRAFEEARARRKAGQRTLLFVDEVHRFNRAQQDGFLPVVEDGTVVLVGATTENPSFALNGALLSRCQVMVLKRLDEPALESLLARAEALAGRALPVTAEARAILPAMADGDGRYLLNLAEQLLALDEVEPLDIPSLQQLLAKRAALYDKDREEHYNLINPTFVRSEGNQINGLLSAFHKSLRGSDPDAALYYACRMLNFGPDLAATVFRRLVCAAAEDVGVADPNALVQAMTAWQAFERVGWPEGRLFFGQAIIYVATAPKSNKAHNAIGEALALAERTAMAEPPLNAQNAPTKMMEKLGYAEGYRYDHDEPEGFGANDLWPEGMRGGSRPTLYEPTERGFEREIQKRMAFWSRRRNKAE